MIIGIKLIGDGLIADDHATIEKHGGRALRISIDPAGYTTLHAEFRDPTRAFRAKSEIERSYLRIAA